MLVLGTGRIGHTLKLLLSLLAKSYANIFWVTIKEVHFAV